VGTRETADHLVRLLSAPGAYRKRWERVSGTSVGPGQLHLPAVCAVLADYLIEQGEIPDRDGDPKRRVRDRVRRALSGEVLTLPTVRAFAGAFSFQTDDLDRLEALLSGSSGVRVLSGRYAGSPAVAAQRRGYRTISLHEHHYVNADHLPYRHRTSQVIEATADQVVSHRYIFDAAALTVDVLHGGSASGEILDMGEGLYAVDIRLTRPLRRGETTSLVYETRFSYPEPPAPEFRRAGVNRVDNLDLLVQFDPTVHPRRVFFASWAALDGDPETETEIHLEPDGSVHVFLAGLEHAIAGFHWQW
jgi:hypothetical protein